MKKITLKNGLRILLVPQPTNLAATVLILVRAGSEYEKKQQNGVSHFLEHLMFKGTTDRPVPGMIAQELAALGAQSNAFTGPEYTGYYAKAQAAKLPKVLEIVSDLYLNPLFDEGEIEKERGVIIQELNMREDDLPTRASRVFDRLVYGDQPAGWPVGDQPGVGGAPVGGHPGVLDAAAGGQAGVVGAAAGGQAGVVGAAAGGQAGTDGGGVTGAAGDIQAGAASAGGGVTGAAGGIQAGAGGGVTGAAGDIQAGAGGSATGATSAGAASGA